MRGFGIRHAERINAINLSFGDREVTKLRRVKDSTVIHMMCSLIWEKREIKKIMNGKMQHAGGRLYFRVVKNLRIEGKPTNHLIKTVASVPPEQLKDAAFRASVSAKIDAELKKLKAEKKITAMDVEKIKERFSKVLPITKRKTLDADLIKAYPFLDENLKA